MRVRFMQFGVALGCVMSAGCVKKPDVVNEAEPMSTAFSGVDEDVAAMASMNTETRRSFIRERYPHLHQGVVYFLRERGMLNRDEEVERVEFRYGSADEVNAESADGMVRGYFSNQLLAFVYIRGLKEPRVVIVQCLNGIFALPEDARERLQAIEARVPVERFTIGRGEGLVHHVGFQVAIDLARRHSLALYRGRLMRESARITFAQARAMEATTDEVQVTVKVFEGDQFDLVAGTYMPANQTL